jgi:signal transduction histidine kinase
MSTEKIYSGVKGSSRRSYIILLIGIAAALGMGYMVFNLYSTAESENFKRDYTLLSEGLLQAAALSLTRMNDMCAHTAAIYSTEFPDPGQWPNVAHSSFGTMMDPIVDSLQVKNINHIPLVLPEELQSFEDFAYGFFDNDTESIPNIGIASFGKGVWAVNETTGVQFHDTTGETAFNSFSFLAPVFQVVNAAANAFVIMLNTHYDESRGSAIDACVTCFYKRVRAGKSTTGCGSLTDFIYLFQDSVLQPASILYYPEFPLRNASKLTGFIGVVFNWDTLIAATVPNFEHENRNKLIIHLSSSSGQVNTYSSHGEEVTYIGTGRQLLNEYYTQYNKKGILDADVGTAVTSVHFELTVFPSEEMVQEYQSEIPLLLGLITGCCVLVVATLLFFFITTKRYEDKITSSLRRIFLRYVSHELRSPLNAVYMGVVELLDSREFHELIHKLDAKKQTTGLKKPASGTNAGAAGAVNTNGAGAANGTSNGTANGAADANGSSGVASIASTASTSGVHPAEADEVSLLHIAKDIKRDTEMAMVVLDDLATYVDLVDDKGKLISFQNTHVLCLRHLAMDCGKSIQHVFNDYQLDCTLSPFRTDSTVTPEGLLKFFTIRGAEADLKLMFTYMLKAATKLCVDNSHIRLVCKSM